MPAFNLLDMMIHLLAWRIKPYQPATVCFFHRGETFPFSERVRLNGNDVLIGAFGTCLNPDERGICENNPLLTYVGGPPADHGAPLHFTGSNLTAQDINLYLESPGGQRVFGYFGGGPQNHLLFRIKMQDFNQNNAAGTDGVFLVSSILRETQHSSFSHSIKRLVMLNTEIGSQFARGHSHILYGGSIEKAVFAYNYFHHDMSGVRLSGNLEPGSWNTVFSNNFIYDTTNSVELVFTGNNSSSRSQNILIEKNFMLEAGTDSNRPGQRNARCYYPKQYFHQTRPCICQ